MPTIVVTTRIAAPVDRCFDLARDVDAHVRTSAGTGERVVAGRMSGLLELGDTVTFEGVHLGVRQRLAARIAELDRPHRFVDEMTQGAFAAMRHVHEFTTEGGVTVMTDTITWRSPLGLLGRIADALVLRNHLRQFLLTKQAALKVLAEAG
jgi:ligand-binding SRPBCC domain-containing protein